MAGPQVVGIQVNVSENASIIAPRIEEQFARIGSAGEEAGKAIQDAFDSSRMTSQLDSFTKNIDKLYETKFGKERDLKLRYMELRNEQMASRAASRQETPADRTLARSGGGPLSTVSRAGAATASIGQTGQVVQPAAGVFEAVTGTVAKAGPIGALVAGVGAILAIGATITDQLVRTYEPFMTQLMDTTAAFGDLKKSAGDNFTEFRKNLRDAGKAASQFGYSLEQGVAVLGQLAAGGIGRTAAMGGQSQIFAYARGFGVGPDSLVNSYVLSQRYGQKDVLGLAAGGTSAQGIGAGRYGEYLGAMTSMFEDAIGKGISRGFEDISGTLNFFSKLGPMWQGELGAQKVTQLGQGVAGATGLQAETDVLLYRAARQQVEQQAKGSFDYVDVMMQLEKGMTVGIFQNVYDQIREMTGGSKTDMVEMLRQTFGINYSMASQLYTAGLPGKEEDLSKLIARLPAPSAKSPEMELIEAENALRLTIIEAGESLLGAKVEIVKGMYDVVKWLSSLAGTSYEEELQRKEDVKVVAATKEFGLDKYDEYVGWLQGANKLGTEGMTFTEMLGGLKVTGAGGGIAMMMDPQYITRSKMTEDEYKKQQEATIGLMTSLSQLNTTQMGMLTGKYAEQIKGALKQVGDKNLVLQPTEMADFYSKFKPILDQVAKESARMTASITTSPRVGSIDALEAFTKPVAGEGAYSFQAAGRSGLKSLLSEFQKEKSAIAGVDIKSTKASITSTFGAEAGAAVEARYTEVAGRVKLLEDALTGMTTGQIEALISSGKLGEMKTKGQLSMADVDALVKALRDNTAALTQPQTVTVQTKR